MNVVETAIQPIDINLIQHYGLPIKYGGTVDLIPGNDVSTWLLNRKLKSQGEEKKALVKQFINMIAFDCQMGKRRN